MKYIDIPIPDGEPLPFFLAAEEFVARKMNEDDCFFMWQVPPSVIFGRNQLIENEVNLDFCRSHHINTFRRKSGGGCVYADQSNIMFSYINSGDGIQFTFDRYVRMVARLLQNLRPQSERKRFLPYSGTKHCTWYDAFRYKHGKHGRQHYPQ